MIWFQKEIALRSVRRGCHIVTDEILSSLPEIKNVKVGLLHLFLMHTSASLSINENADPDVPIDLESSLNAIAPEDFPYRHDCEGPDDMPAHVKSSLVGCFVTLPIRAGRVVLGTWQGIYLCEHRNQGGSRRVMATGYGESTS